MIRKLGQCLWNLIILGIIGISSAVILNASYISCYILLLTVYVICSIWFVGKISNYFSEDERFMDSLQYRMSFLGTLITIIFLILTIILLILIIKHGLFDYISQSFAYLVTDIVKIPGGGILPQINL